MRLVIRIEIFIENYKKYDRPGGLSILRGLPGLVRMLAWPAWHRPGRKIMACACHRQAGPGRQAGLTACFILCGGTQFFIKQCRVHLVESSYFWNKKGLKHSKTFSPTSNVVTRRSCKNSIF
jgi:hypothetical protein